MTKQIPNGWIETTLGEIAEPSRERVSPNEVPKLRYIGLEHIEPQTMKLRGYRSASEIRSSSGRFRKGDVLYGRMRPYLNKVWVAEFGGLCSAEFLVFPKRKGLNSQFLAFRLNAEDFVAFANGQVSGERPRVGFEKLSRFPVLLPPTAEQQRIVAKLNVALSAVSRAEAATRRARERLQRYRAAVLQEAITGELTREWREKQQSSQAAHIDTGEILLHNLLTARRAHWEESELARLRSIGSEPRNDKWKSRYREPSPPNANNLTTLPKGWTWAAVGQVGEVTLGRQLAPQHHRGKYMHPYLRVANVLEDRIDISDVKRMNFTPREFEVYRLKEGDILLNEGQSLDQVGRPAMYRGEVPNCCFQKTLLRFRAQGPINRYYALIVFRAYLHNGRFQRSAKITTNLAHLAAERFIRIEFPLPPSAEQEEIVREVEHRLSAADRLETRLEQQLSRAQATRQSLVLDAISGHLVPQVSTDESASALVESINADRKFLAKKTKGKRMSRPKSRASSRRPLIDILREHEKPITPEELFHEAGFQPSQVDLFYRELASLRKSLKERKPSGSQAKSWPYRSYVELLLEES